ncbi:MAG: ribonuclease III, partial [Candidatus Zixiibacteriota bacterium]
RDVILRLIYANKDSITTDSNQRNYKGELLELVQASGEGMPRYDTVHEEGPDHDKTFDVEVYVGDVKTGSGRGNSKKEAEQKAAGEALNHYRRDA